MKLNPTLLLFDKRRSRAKKYLKERIWTLTFLLSFCFICLGNAQMLSKSSLQNMTDAELRSYWTEAQSQGLDLGQLSIMAKAQGLTPLELEKLQKRIGNLRNNNDSIEKLTLDSKSSDTSSFGTVSRQNNNSNPSPIFGASFFNNPNITHAPSLNIATPMSYQLGSGDEIVIEIWGAATHQYQLSLNRDGNPNLLRS